MDELIAACDRVREAGYAVVPKTEYDLWQKWLRESSERTVAGYDREQRLLWELGRVVDKATELVKPSRPQWLRDAKRFLSKGEWNEPIVRNTYM